MGLGRPLAPLQPERAQREQLEAMEDIAARLRLNYRPPAEVLACCYFTNSPSPGEEDATGRRVSFRGVSSVLRSHDKRRPAIPY
jgi:hypothetical protein